MLKLRNYDHTQTKIRFNFTFNLKARLFQVPDFSRQVNRPNGEEGVSQSVDTKTGKEPHSNQSKKRKKKMKQTSEQTN